MKVTVEILEYISYSTQEIEGYECSILWGSNKEFLYLYSVQDEYVLEYLFARGIDTNDVVIDYVNKGYVYVA